MSPIKSVPSVLMPALLLACLVPQSFGLGARASETSVDEVFVDKASVVDTSDVDFLGDPWKNGYKAPGSGACRFGPCVYGEMFKWGWYTLWGPARWIKDKVAGDNKTSSGQNSTK